MIRAFVLFLYSVCAVTGSTCAGTERVFLIGAPDVHPTPVTRKGAIREPWGHVTLSATLTNDGDGSTGLGDVRRHTNPVPTVRMSAASGPVTCTAEVIRAPAWPGGFDMLTLTVANDGDSPEDVSVSLHAPQDLKRKGQALCRGRRTLVSLAPAPAVLRATGCVTGARALPGWGRPNRPCDPAFRNIRAGLGGIPITYRFAVPPGAGRWAVLGFCESHWREPGKRPVRIRTEGAPEKTLDPLATWGKDTPGIVRTPAVDRNEDGWIDVSVLPSPGAPDLNPILNVLWIVQDHPSAPDAAVVGGALSGSCEYRVDVGGPSDRPVTRPGVIRWEAGRATYPLALDPGETVTLPVLLSAGSGPIPVWEETVWTPAALRQAAERVWAAWFREEDLPASLGPAATERVRGALADIAMTRFQHDGFFLALPAAGPATTFSFAAADRIVHALAAAGLNTEAQRMLRAYWDAPPASIADIVQSTDGHWEDPAESACPHGHALLALARHARLAGEDWAEQVYPALRKGALWLRTHRDPAMSSDTGAAVCAHALREAAACARRLGKDDDAEWMQETARKTGGGSAVRPSCYEGLGPVVDEAAFVVTACRGHRVE